MSSVFKVHVYFFNFNFFIDFFYRAFIKKKNYTLCIEYFLLYLHRNKPIISAAKKMQNN